MRVDVETIPENEETIPENEEYLIHITSFSNKKGCSWRIARAVIGIALSVASVLASTIFKDKVSKKTRNILFGTSAGWTLGGLMSDLFAKHKANKYADICHAFDHDCPYEIDPYRDDEE